MSPFVFHWNIVMLLAALPLASAAVLLLG